MSVSLDELEAAVDALVAEPVFALDAVDLTDRACRLETMSRRIEAARCQALAAAASAIKCAPADQFDALADGGIPRQPHNVVADETRAEPRAIRSALRLGEWLANFPILADAFAQGILSRRHIERLRSADNRRTHHFLANDQEFFVNVASTCDYIDFTRALSYWRIAADPDGEEPKEQVADSGCWWGENADGSVSGKFRLDPLSGKAFAAALDAESQRLFRQEKDQAADPDHPTTGPKATARRDADALVNLVIAGAEAPDGPATTPLVSIVMSESVAENLLHRLDDATVDPIEVRFDDPDRRCEFIDGTPVHPNLALTALAVARFQRIVVDANNRPIESSVASRTFPPWMKHLLLIESRGRCRAPGCDAPFPWLQADHIKPHSKGGETKLSNGQALCDPHNKAKRDHWEEGPNAA